jgi:uncharacterized protein
MKLTLDADSRVNLIHSYGPGEVRVGGRTVRGNCIVTADTVVEDWNAPSAQELRPEHLAPILALEPEVVLLGTGAEQRFPSKEVRAAFLSKRIALETMDLGAACRTFNILVQEGRRIAAALFVR